MRRAARVDDNQAEIVGALRDVGYSVQSLAALGKGVPDLLVGGIDRRTGQEANWIMEVKDGSKPPSDRRLTPDEAAWHERWAGPVAVVETVEDALRLVGVVEA